MPNALFATRAKSESLKAFPDLMQVRFRKNAAPTRMPESVILDHLPINAALLVDVEIARFIGHRHV